MSTTTTPPQTTTTTPQQPKTNGDEHKKPNTSIPALASIKIFCVEIRTMEIKSDTGATFPKLSCKGVPRNPELDVMEMKRLCRNREDSHLYYNEEFRWFVIPYSRKVGKKNYELIKISKEEAAGLTERAKGSAMFNEAGMIIHPGKPFSFTCGYPKTGNIEAFGTILVVSGVRLGQGRDIDMKGNKMPLSYFVNVSNAVLCAEDKIKSLKDLTEKGNLGRFEVDNRENPYQSSVVYTQLIGSDQVPVHSSIETDITVACSWKLDKFNAVPKKDEKGKEIPIVEEYDYIFPRKKIVLQKMLKLGEKAPQKKSEVYDGKVYSMAIALNYYFHEDGKKTTRPYQIITGAIYQPPDLLRTVRSFAAMAETYGIEVALSMSRDVRKSDELLQQFAGTEETEMMAVYINNTLANVRDVVTKYGFKVNPAEARKAFFALGANQKDEDLSKPKTFGVKECTENVINIFSVWDEKNPEKEACALTANPSYTWYVLVSHNKGKKITLEQFNNGFIEALGNYLKKKKLTKDPEYQEDPNWKPSDLEEYHADIFGVLERNDQSAKKVSKPPKVGSRKFAPVPMPTNTNTTTTATTPVKSKTSETSSEVKPTEETKESQDSISTVTTTEETKQSEETTSVDSQNTDMTISEDQTQDPNAQPEVTTQQPEPDQDETPKKKRKTPSSRTHSKKSKHE